MYLTRKEYIKFKLMKLEELSLGINLRFIVNGKFT